MLKISNLLIYVSVHAVGRNQIEPERHRPSPVLQEHKSPEKVANHKFKNLFNGFSNEFVLIETLMTKSVITKIQNLCQLLLPLAYLGYKKVSQRQVRHYIFLIKYCI